jgi:hypothetical protein
MNWARAWLADGRGTLRRLWRRWITRDEDMTPRARQIYGALRTAIARRRAR